jgi:hypothetical protein
LTCFASCGTVSQGAVHCVRNWFRRYFWFFERSWNAFFGAGTISPIELHIEVWGMAWNLALFILFALCASAALARIRGNDASKSNNPLNAVACFNLQNYITPSLFGMSGHNDDFLLRPTILPGRHSLIPVSDRRPRKTISGRF